MSFQGLTYTWICCRLAPWPNTCRLLAFLLLTLSISLLQIPGSHLHLWRKAYLLLHLDWKVKVFPKEIKLSFNSGRAVRYYPPSGDPHLSLWQPRPAYASPWVKQFEAELSTLAAELILWTEAGGNGVGKAETHISALQAIPVLTCPSCIAFLYKEYWARRGHLLHQVGSLSVADSYISMFIKTSQVFIHSI